MFDWQTETKVALATDPDPNPHAIAERIADKIPEDDLREVVRQLLHRVVPGIEGTERRALVREAAATATPHTPPAPEADDRPISSSNRWGRWSAVLNRRIYVDGTWKTVGECSAADCRAAAELRRKQAEATLAQAAWWDALGNKIATRGVTTVAELDTSDLDEIGAPA